MDITKQLKQASFKVQDTNEEVVLVSDAVILAIELQDKLIGKFLDLFGDYILKQKELSEIERDVLNKEIIKTLNSKAKHQK